jgi:hypothetical protein
MTHAYIADSVKGTLLGFISLTRLSKNRNIEITLNAVIFKGVFVRFCALM